MARPRIIAPTVIIFALCFGLFVFFGKCPPFNIIITQTNESSSVIGRGRPSHQALQALIEYGSVYKIPSVKPSHNNEDTIKYSTLGTTEKALIARNPRYAITSSVQTASFTTMALVLGYSIQKHNDLRAMDAELVLLIREDNEDGVSAENRTRLEKAGWKIRVAEELKFDGVDNSAIRPHHRHNLNKLHLWTWTEYERILFIDADVVCHGSLEELWQMPGDFAASPDVWWDVITDNKFNSGVIVFRPSVETFRDMIVKVSDPTYHQPNDADQAFLNAYYRFRYFGLPYKYNLNLIMVHSLL